MICPVMSYHRENFFVERECEEEDCAWWDRNRGKCAIVTLAENSESVSEAAAGQRTIFVKEV